MPEHSSCLPLGVSWGPSLSPCVSGSPTSWALSAVWTKSLSLAASACMPSLKESPLKPCASTVGRWLDTAVVSLGSHLGSPAGLGPVIWGFGEVRGQS